MIAFHPLADIFPLVEGQDFAELVDDIREHGLHEPIVVYEDKILDGRNRYRACEAAGKEPTFAAYTGDDPVAYVVSLNLRRRHLDESQRAMVAAKLATFGHGGDRSKSPIGDLTQAKAADLLNVGKRSVERAAEVRDHGAPRRGVHHSRRRHCGPANRRAARDRRAREREILEAARSIRAKQAEQRRAERLARVAAQADAGPLPRDRKYPVILADPPYRYDFSDTSSRAIEAKYETMSLEEICALPVGEIATPIAVLFLFVPSAILEEAFEIIEAWGFTYKAAAVWEKTSGFGEGHYFRQQHEHLLLATRGDMPPPPPRLRPASIIKAPRREHSRKP